MRNVVIFRTELLHGSETFIRSQAAALSMFNPVFAGLRRVEKSLPLPDQTIVVTEQGAKLTAEFRAKLYRNTGYGPQFHKRVSDLNPLLVHAHFATDAVTALPLVDSLGVPFIVTLHGYDVTMSDEYHATTRAGRRFMAKRQQLWQRANLFLCVSEFIRKKAIEGGFPEEKLRVQHIGINVASFSRRDGEPTEEIVLFVGRLVEKKGCQQLLQAMQLVMKMHPAARTIIIGDGPLRQSMESLASTLGVTCSFLGSQPEGNIRAWLSRAMIFCVPSIEAANKDSEGFGMVFLEAQAMGVPVVSFRHGGIPEAVVDGVTGLLAKEGNAFDLHEQLIRLMEDQDLRRAFGSAGAAFVREKFDLMRKTRELEEIYEAISG